MREPQVENAPPLVWQAYTLAQTDAKATSNVSEFNTQNLSFLKRKSAIACFSPAPSGLMYLNTMIVIIY
jgi:hypothetical protein